jgi:glycosyltransferase involved in cell wall biosynthesis
MRIFVLGLPHTITSPVFSSCAYTMKVWNLCRMMTDRGHEVIHFGNEGSHPVCTENVNVTSRQEWERAYQHPGRGFFDITFETPERKQFYAKFVESMRAEIERRLNPEVGTIICVTWGGPQRDAVLPLMSRAFVVESGIGYVYSWSDYRVFESYAWLHMTLGREGLVGGGKWYWPVIPNAFDPEMFTYRENKDDYLLYLGRLTEDKGVGLVVDLAKRTGSRLRIAGQGDPTPYLAPHVEYLGPLGVEERREVVSKARALICPTYYVEPFGGVNVEAQMSGTPVLSTDYGAFTETVLHGITGYRCRTMEHFEFAVRHLDRISPAACRHWAMNFSLSKIGGMYEEYFRMILDIRGDGFYAQHPERQELDWLSKSYPVPPPC